VEVAICSEASTPCPDVAAENPPGGMLLAVAITICKHVFTM